MENPLVVLIQVARAFDALGIDYVVVGSFASSIHGEYRASGDIDIIANVDFRHIEPLVATLKDEFYIDDLIVRRAIERGRSFNVIHLKAIFKVDIFVPATDLAKQQLSRRQQYKLDPTEEQRIWIASAEDTILAKLEWYRMGKEVSELQWRDVKGIIGTQASELDFEYLNRWAESLGLLELLDRAMKDSQ
ncbi:MAG: hypothetical protein QOG23_4962 [Blastocatellia bacterium]|jgi:hypothetical protein|nr:hypothetical protein [Blastocatellia bacterium]